MTVAVTLAKSKTGRKLLRYAIVACLAILVSFAVLIMVVASAVASILFGSGSSGSASATGAVSSTGSITVIFSKTEPAESAYALAHIPNAQTSPSVVTFPILYAAATQNGSCVMPWPILAGVANEETTFGTSRSAGVSSGSNGAGAEGPFQFEPATFAGYANPTPAFPGAAIPPSIYDATNAAFSAARKLCQDGILVDPKYALWTYNAGLVGVTFQLVNGAYMPVYNDSIFAGSSDNPARYVNDVIENAALYGGGTISGSSTISVAGLAPGSGNTEPMRARSALWMDLFGNGLSCEQALQTPCWNAMPTILADLDGIALPAAPSAMRSDLGSVSAPHAGDVILFGSYVTTTDRKTHQQTTTLQINNNAYAVMIDSSSHEIALVGSKIQIVKLSAPVTEGQQIDGMTVQVVGSPF